MNSTNMSEHAPKKLQCSLLPEDKSGKPAQILYATIYNPDPIIIIDSIGNPFYPYPVTRLLAQYHDVGGIERLSLAAHALPWKGSEYHHAGTALT